MAKQHASAAVVVLTFFGSIGAQAAFANAFFASFPTSVRQTYEDGSFTEMVCGRGMAAATPCTFLVGDGKATRVFSVRAPAGYVDPIVEYNYFDNGSPVGINTTVRCRDADLAALRPALRDSDATCLLWMDLVGDELLATHVDITAYAGNDEQRETRFFTGPRKPDAMERSPLTGTGVIQLRNEGKSVTDVAIDYCGTGFPGRGAGRLDLAPGQSQGAAMTVVAGRGTGRFRVAWTGANGQRHFAGFPCRAPGAEAAPVRGGQQTVVSLTFRDEALDAELRPDEGASAVRVDVGEWFGSGAKAPLP